MNKILFITHESSRTGAPLVLFHFLQWLKENKPGLNFTILDIHGGDLSEEFKEIANNYHCLEKLRLSESFFYKELQVRILKRMGKYKTPIHPRDLLIQELANKDFDVIYANSVLSLPVANKLKDLSKSSKLILHVHELNTIIQQLFPNFSNIINGVDKFIAVSNLVKQNLNSVYHVQQDKIKVIYGFSKVPVTQITEKKDSFIVGGAGTVHWRKGSDIFIQVARYIKDHYKEVTIKFEWVGHLSEEQKYIAKGDIQKAGLQEIVSFVGEKVEPFEFFKNFDLFLLCSREDPFPLVAIEVGTLGIPMICFEGATGTEEVLRNGGGEIVPYLNIEMVAKQVVNYYNERNKLLKDGQRSSELFSSYSSDNICPEIINLIESI